MSTAKEAIRIAPNSYPAVYNLMFSRVKIGRLGEAKLAFKEARSRGVDAPALHMARYWVAFLQNNAADMEEQVTWASGKQGAEQELLGAKYDTEAYHGRFVKARQLASDVLRAAVSQEAAGYATVSFALQEAEVGNADRARKAAGEALRLTSGRADRASGALVYALAGGSTQALKIAAELNQEFPAYTYFRSAVPAIRAAVALDQRDSADAIRILESARPYEMSEGSVAVIYVRGLAYLQARKAILAAGGSRSSSTTPGPC